MATPWDPWLTVDDYKAWARIDPADTTDDAAIQQAVNASTEALQLRAPAAFQMDDQDPPQPIPVPRMIVEAGLLLTNRLMARRNSPDGVVGVSDMGTTTILSYDADITQLVSPWTEMVLG